MEQLDPDSDWDHAYHECGFEPVDAGGACALHFRGASLFATPRRDGLIHVDAAYESPRTVVFRHGYASVPPTWSASLVAHLARSILVDILPSSEHPSVRETFPMSVLESEKITLASLDAGTYVRYLALDPAMPAGSYCGARLHTMVSYAAEVAAEHSTRPDLLERLVFDHPDMNVRLLAFRNESCPAEVDSRLAVARRPEDRRLFMLKASITRETYEIFARDVSMLPVVDTDDTTSHRQRTADERGILFWTLMSDKCPIDLLPVLIKRYLQYGSRRRLELASSAQALGPMERRRTIFSILLSNAYASNTTAKIISCINENSDDADWLKESIPPRIRGLLQSQ